MDKSKIIIFCDGASKGNPGPGGYGAVVVLPEGKVIELGGSEKNTTNNRMELTGAIEALQSLGQGQSLSEITVYTDSKYLINGVTGWIYGWQKNGWRTKEKKEVLNKDLWEELAELIKGKKINWHYVGGHVGVAGNERCDEIASGLAKGEPVKLFTGKLTEYKINILDLGHDEEKKTIKHSKGAKAYSYLSLVGGVLHIDKTWPECEKRVKGQKGAKFQKAISEIHEAEILRSWGVK
jgi:ribonuclease HI